MSIEQWWTVLHNTVCGASYLPQLMSLPIPLCALVCAYAWPYTVGLTALNSSLAAHDATLQALEAAAACSVAPAPDPAAAVSVRRWWLPAAAASADAKSKDPASAVAVPALKYVAAPMVGQSDLPFRTLLRQYGATTCYTQMIDADAFVRRGTQYRAQQLQVYRPDDAAPPATTGPPEAQVDAAAVACPAAATAAALPIDRPLIMQLCGHDVPSLVAAALLAAPHMDGVDLNLGCPQERAQTGHYGAYMTAHRDWPLIYTIVRCWRASLPPHIAVCAKIRLLSTTALTIQFVTMLHSAGCDVLAVHGRVLLNARRRRAGAADLTAVDAVCAAVAQLNARSSRAAYGGHRLVVLSNGNVRCAADVLHNARTLVPRADGLMVGEAILADPTLFAAAAALEREYEKKTDALVLPPHSSSRLVPLPLPRALSVALEYLALCDVFSAAPHHHVTPVSVQLQHIKNLVRHYITPPLPSPPPDDAQAGAAPAARPQHWELPAALRPLCDAFQAEKCVGAAAASATKPQSTADLRALVTAALAAVQQSSAGTAVATDLGAAGGGRAAAPAAVASASPAIAESSDEFDLSLLH